MHFFSVSDIVNAMVNRMRSTRSHTGNRRSHHALEMSSMTVCLECKAPIIRHTACQNCGKYNGRMVIDVISKISKKEAKQKEKAKETGKETTKPEKK